MKFRSSSFVPFPLLCLYLCPRSHLDLTLPPPPHATAASASHRSQAPPPAPALLRNHVGCVEPVRREPAGHIQLPSTPPQHTCSASLRRVDPSHAPRTHAARQARSPSLRCPRRSTSRASASLSASTSTVRPVLVVFLVPRVRADPFEGICARSPLGSPSCMHPPKKKKKHTHTHNSASRQGGQGHGRHPHSRGPAHHQVPRGTSVCLGSSAWPAWGWTIYARTPARIKIEDGRSEMKCTNE